MKKVIAVMVIMAVFSTTVFAAPLSAAGSLDKTSLEGFRSELSTKTDSHNDVEDLFVDVQAVALTSEEAQAVEGGKYLGFLLASVVNYLVLPKLQSYAYAAQITNNTNPERALANTISLTFITGSIIMGIGIALPW